MGRLRVATRAYLYIAYNAVETLSLWMDELTVVTLRALLEDLFWVLRLDLLQLKSNYSLVIIRH
jgi:hypothetical protein